MKKYDSQELYNRAEEIQKNIKCSVQESYKIAKEEFQPLNHEDYAAIRDALDQRIRDCNEHIESMTGVHDGLKKEFERIKARAEATFNKLEAQDLI